MRYRRHSEAFLHFPDGFFYTLVVKSDHLEQSGAISQRFCIFRTDSSIRWWSKGSGGLLQNPGHCFSTYSSIRALLGANVRILAAFCKISFGPPPAHIVISENSSSSVVLLPLAPVSLIVQLFDAFLAFSLLFGSFLLYVQEGSVASIQVDMQIEAAARLKSTVSDLPALEISGNFSFGPPPRIFNF